MTIEECIDNAKHITTKDRKIGLHLCFTKRELQALLEQVAKEQREICQVIFDSHADITNEEGEHLSHSSINGISERIKNAPSPLKED